MDDPIDWQLLARYLAGSCSPSDDQAIEAWIEADPTRQQFLRELEIIWAASDAPASSLDDATLEADWNRIAAALGEADAPAVPPSPAEPSPNRQARPVRSRRARPFSLQTALYGLLAATLLVGAIWFGVTQWGFPIGADPSLREVIAERGERANIHLADGTTVTLNVDSRLQMPTSFADGRVVHLEGEAYFNVATDSTRPFIVRTGHAEINVHGTSFNVRSYPEDRRVQVAVVEGAVSLRPQRAPSARPGARLESGQVGRLESTSARVTTSTTDDIASILSWMNGRLVFEDAPLREVTARLERWYNLEFDVADPALDSLRLTASLKSRSVRNVLDVVTASLDIRYRIHQNTVVLTDNTYD